MRLRAEGGWYDGQELETEGMYRAASGHDVLEVKPPDGQKGTGAYVLEIDDGGERYLAWVTGVIFDPLVQRPLPPNPPTRGSGGGNWNTSSG